MNLAASGRVRVALGAMWDVVLIEGGVRACTDTDVPAGWAEAFAATPGVGPMWGREPNT